MKSKKTNRKDPFPIFEMEEAALYRIPRLEHLFFEEIDRLFRLEVSDPRLQYISIASLQLSPDLRNAKIQYAVVEKEQGATTEKELRLGFEKVTPFLRARLAEALSLKRVPMLHFHRDRLAEASLRARDVLQKEEQP